MKQVFRLDLKKPHTLHGQRLDEDTEDTEIKGLRASWEIEGVLANLWLSCLRIGGNDAENDFLDTYSCPESSGIKNLDPAEIIATDELGWIPHTATTQTAIFLMHPCLVTKGPHRGPLYLHAYDFVYLSYDKSDYLLWVCYFPERFQVQLKGRLRVYTQPPPTTPMSPYSLWWYGRKFNNNECYMLLRYVFP